MNSMGKEIIIYEKKVPLIFAVLFSFFFFIFSSFIKGLVFKLPFMLVSGIFVLLYMKKIFNPKPILKINSDGITDNSDMIGVGFIKWSEISKIDFEDSIVKKLIIIHLKDPKRYFNNQESKLKCFISKILLKFNSNSNEVIIHYRNLNFDFVKMKEEILVNMERCKVKNS